MPDGSERASGGETLWLQISKNKSQKAVSHLTDQCVKDSSNLKTHVLMSI